MTPPSPPLPSGASRGGLALTGPELIAWGRRMGAQAQPPLIIAMFGQLGAGKTTLAAAICAGYGVRDEVTSPTFALVHTYDAPRSLVHHLDLYRLESPRELQNIGWDDVVAANPLVIIEWPERAGELLPEQHIPIELRHPEGQGAEEPDRRVLYAGGHVGYRTGAR